MKLIKIPVWSGQKASAKQYLMYNIYTVVTLNTYIANF